MPRPAPSLASRLWLVLALAVLPLFALTMVDYREQRANALSQVRQQARLMLHGAAIIDEAATRQTQQTLLTMVNANDTRDLDPAACSALAARMLGSAGDYANLGAAGPDGEIFCSGRTMNHKVNVQDRAWFKEASNNTVMTRGEFLEGRISGQPAVVFGLPLHNADGSLRAVFFASANIHWFNRLTEQSPLPESWHSLLFSHRGQVISHYPDSVDWRGKSFEESSLAELKAALARNEDSVQLADFAGNKRLFVIAPVRSADGGLFVSISIPLATTVAAIEQQLWQRLSLLLLVALASLIVARLYLYRLVEEWLRELEVGTGQLAAGKLDIHLSTHNLPRSLATVTHRFNDMAAALRLREQQLLDERQAIGELNRQLSNKIAALESADQHLRRLSTAVEQSPASIVITDVDANIVYVNEAFTRTSGYTAAEAIGRNPRLLNSGETPAATYQAMWACLRSGKTWRGELINKRKDGSRFLEMATISPVRDSDGRIMQYVSVKDDITSQRATEAELAAHRQHLEQLVEQRTEELARAKLLAESANRAKSNFLANMSHEIRTPMNAIIGLNHLLLQTPLTPTQREKLHKVAGAAEHLLQIINNILDLSKIEAGRLTLEDQAFSPEEVLESVAAMVRDQARAKGLDLHVDSQSLPARVRGDSARLRQILVNFASNAVKFTDRGSIMLCGHGGGADAPPGECHFSVSDTGIGIAAEDIPRLFAVFEQLESSSDRRFGGSGLGLAIARHLAELMGGEVGVSSQPGQGSTFWLKLCLAPLNGAGSSPEAASKLPPDNGFAQLQGRVLVVDDETLNREVTENLLQLMGLDVVVADSGQAAIERCREEKFDLILMDIQMPGIDGIEASRQIRLLPGGNLPIVAFTANAFTEERRRCLAAGLDDFLGKPISAPDLQSTLGRHLPRFGATPRIPATAGTGNAAELAALVPALEELRSYLQTGDIAARECHERLRDRLQAASPQANRELQRHLAAFDFEPALRCLDQLLEKIGKKD